MISRTMSGVLGLDTVYRAHPVRGTWFGRLHPRCDHLPRRRPGLCLLLLGSGYSLILAGLAFQRAMAAFTVVKRHYRALMIAGGGLLVAIGVLEITGLWSWAVQQLPPPATAPPDSTA
jgi:hypothetical protein